MTKEKVDRVLKTYGKIKRFEIEIARIEKALAQIEGLHCRTISVHTIDNSIIHDIDLTEQETREFLAEVLNNRKKDLAELEEQLEQM